MGPAVVGVFRPSIVLPAWVLGASSDTQHVILQHESEHIAAGDSGLLTAAAVLVALMPWNLALWWQYLRLRSTVETDCDARVLARGKTDVRRYSEVLLRVASKTVNIPALSPAMGRNRSLIERRLIAMTAGPGRHPRAQISAMAGIACLALVTAADTSSPLGSLSATFHISAAKLSFRLVNGQLVQLSLKDTTIPGLQPSHEARTHVASSTFFDTSGPQNGVVEIQDLEINGRSVGAMTVPVHITMPMSLNVTSNIRTSIVNAVSH
jgi:hypothetical protein